ncbi:unnamed protein product, partial [Meganyctiphanes norvegica]
MPPKRKASSEAVGSKNPKMKNPAKAPKRVAAKGFTLPDPIDPGEVLTDVTKKQWIIGKSIGVGGFGEIYLASDNVKKTVDDSANYCVKIEPHTNGPLFTEMHCYMRVHKCDIRAEMGVYCSKFASLGGGKNQGKGRHYGQKYTLTDGYTFRYQNSVSGKPPKMIFKKIMNTLDVYEYIHSKEYIHADVKQSNLCIGRHPGTENNVFLVDLGLSTRFTSGGKHKERKFDPRKAHDGTIEYTSRDAHIGVSCRPQNNEKFKKVAVHGLIFNLSFQEKISLFKSDCNFFFHKTVHRKSFLKAFGSACCIIRDQRGILWFLRARPVPGLVEVEETAHVRSIHGNASTPNPRVREFDKKKFMPKKIPVAFPDTDMEDACDPDEEGVDDLTARHGSPRAAPRREAEQRPRSETPR